MDGSKCRQEAGSGLEEAWIRERRDGKDGEQEDEEPIPGRTQRLPFSNGPRSHA
jgi:hypothetical protein